VTRYTFRRRDRIPEGEDFVRTVRTRPVVKRPGLRLHARENGLGRSRLGVSVGRRFGGAVRRNRMKRLAREAFRTSGGLRALGLDVVVVATGSEALDRPEGVAGAFDELVARARRPGRGEAETE
jgi:ribonuclease P protein component